MTDCLTIDALVPVECHGALLEETVGEAFLGQPPLECFSPLATGFLADLSGQILSDPAIRQFPEFAAFGFWVRRATLDRLAARHGDCGNVLRVPRGMVLHIAPANVDTVFLYSFSLSLLAGNLNVVRLSSRSTEQVSLILEHIRRLMQKSEWQAVAARNRFISYPHDVQVNEYLSRRADVRVLWGGDRTVQAFRTLTVRAHAKDLAFPDRFSYCAIEAVAYLAADAGVRSRLAQLFYNDAYTFEQKACSSPSVVYFVGECEECRRAAAVFWGQLDEVLARAQRPVVPGVEMNQLVFAYEQMLRGTVSAYPGFKADRAKHLPWDGKSRPQMCGGGLFLERFVPSLDVLRDDVRAEDQTLTYFGFDQAQLRSFAASLRGRGLSRIVPIGQALTFSEYWDGYDVMVELTRSVTVT